MNGRKLCETKDLFSVKSNICWKLAQFFEKLAKFVREAKLKY